MRLFILSATMVVVFLLTHLLLWKIRLPKYQIQTLLITAVVVFCGWIIASIVWKVHLLGVVHASLFYWSVVLCYVITYSAVEGDSPTLSLMRLLSGKKDEGCSLPEIEVFFAKRPFIRARLVALFHSSSIKEVDQRYYIAGKPSAAFRLILWFRKIFGDIPKGG